MKKLKIAMIGHKRIPSREGGIEIVVEELTTRLARKGYKVTVYNRSDHKTKEENNDKFDTYKNVRIISVPTINKKGLAAFSSSLFATLHAIFCKYNCIHYHAEGPAVMLLLPHLLGIRTVVTVHGLDWQRAKWRGFAVKYIKFGEKITAKYADQVIVLSKNVQKYFRNTYNRETVFISNGISKPIYMPINKIYQRWNLEKDQYILFLGRIVPEKGIHYLIEAFKNVNTKRKLVIAGGSSDTSTYMEELKLLSKWDERIVFTDFVQGELLEALYSNAYIYVLPSDLEGMPISLLEAMSYGNCCVVSDIPECVEVVEDKAVVFHAGDKTDLQTRLQYLCDNKEIVESYKKYASSFILNKYSWDSVIDETLKQYIDG